jgi:plasmid stabilization system protein ParE
VDAANRVEQAILDACQHLAAFPLSGKVRGEVTKASVRFWTVSKYPNYIVVNRPHTRPIEIVAILHGKRDLPSALR